MDNKRKIKTIDTTSPVCPYCGLHETAHFENGLIGCRNCKMVFEYQKNTVVTYSTFKFDGDINV